MALRYAAGICLVLLFAAQAHAATGLLAGVLDGRLPNLAADETAEAPSPDLLAGFEPLSWEITLPRPETGLWATAAFKPRPKSWGVALVLSAIILPGAGHFYLGDPLSIGVGVFHLAVQVACTIAYFLVDQDRPYDVLAVALVSALNWLINSIDVVLLCARRNAELASAKIEFHGDRDLLGISLRVCF
jgi:hypothetical protein